MKQTSRGSCPPVIEGVIGRVRRRSAAQPNFFLRYLVAITFPIEFDVWDRLCTHCGVPKVMTLHLSVNILEEKKNRIFLFFLKREEPLLVKEVLLVKDF